MLPFFLRRATSGLLALTVAGIGLLGPAAGNAAAAPWEERDQFADESFRTTWARTDEATVRGGRTLYWGPAPWFDYAEFYRQGVNGLRTVQYFDKARMEINNPNDRSYQNGVTNGLLVVEMVSGNLQLGNDSFDSDTRGAANVPVAGNPLEANPSAPTYSSFAGVATINNGYRDPNRLGQRIGATLDKGGNIGLRDALATPETEIVQYNSNTGHNIPRVFWDFLNATGPIVENGRVTTGPIVDWVFAMGLPITDAYWTRARIGNAEQDVLVQLFERRVLTYTPANSAEFKVEMGNVGQHYFQWRYPRLGTPWAAPEPSLPLIYASDKDTGGKHWELYTQLDGRTVRLTQEVAESVAYSYRRSWDPAQVRLLIDSRRSDNTHRQLFELDAPVVSGTDGGIVRLSYTDGKPVPPNAPYQGYLPNGAANDFNASVSPDGTKLIFVSDREGLPELYIMALNGQGGPTKLLTDGCVAQVPSWSPDGRKLYWESKCGDAQFKLVQGDIAYGDDRAYGVYASLVNVVALLPNQSGDNRFPRVSPDGTQVAFSSTRDGNSEVYLVNVDGSNLRRLTNDAGEDEAPTWNAAGTALAFASNRDGDYEIYTMRADGSDLQRVTDNSANDRWALWAQ